MSLTQEHTVWCDRCVVWVRETGSPREVRKIVARQGWTRRKGEDGRMEDVCPACKEEDHTPPEQDEAHSDAVATLDDKSR